MHHFEVPNDVSNMHYQIAIYLFTGNNDSQVYIFQWYIDLWRPSWTPSWIALDSDHLEKNENSFQILQTFTNILIYNKYCYKFVAGYPPKYARYLAWFATLMLHCSL